MGQVGGTTTTAETARSDNVRIVRVSRPAPTPDMGLRRRLVVIDAAATLVGWSVMGGATWLHATTPGPAWRSVTAADAAALLGPTVVAVAATAALLVSQRLYRTRTCSLRSREVLGLARSCAGAAICVLALPAPAADMVPPPVVVVGAAAALAALTAGRAGFNVWLRTRRAEGRFVRRVVIVGDNSEAAELVSLLADHRELGYEVCGYTGRADAAAMAVPWLGPVERAAAATKIAGATGAVVASSALSPDVLNLVVRQLLDGGINVRLSCALRGVAQQRLVAAPLAHEPLFYVAGVEHGRTSRVGKRALDVLVAGVMLAATAPLLVVIAAAVRLDSPGPALFRQRRAGRGGLPFTMYKFRTMHVAAEAQRGALRQHNVRDGPLFKVADDPRVTRVGRLLRAVSIDELPQLYNVLRGSMSLVGPRPLPLDEAAAVHEYVPRRVSLAPGLTGMWQVEARDNPAFGPLRRLDSYYVENASLWLDLRILVSTAAHLVGRPARLLRQRRHGADGAVVLE